MNDEEIKLKLHVKPANNGVEPVSAPAHKTTSNQSNPIKQQLIKFFHTNKHEKFSIKNLFE